MNGTAVSRGVNPILTAIPGLAGTYAWPQLVINAGGQITAISSLTTFTGNLTVTGTLNAGALVVTGNSTFAGPSTFSGTSTFAAITVTGSATFAGPTTASGGFFVNGTAASVAAVFTTPSDTQVQINASGTGQFSTLQFTQAGVIHGQIFTDNTNGFLEITVNNGTSGLKLMPGSGGILGQGPITSAFVDMTPDRGTFTMTHTGFNAGVTSTATWYKIGKAIILNTGTVSGTSNATTWTATGMPTGLQSSLLQTITIGDAEDNGAGTPATVAVSVSSGTLTFGKGSISGGAWTNTGTKGFFNSGGTTFTYLLG